MQLRVRFKKEGLEELVTIPEASMESEIRNCEFRVKCPKSWERLEITSISTQRHCHECQRTVFYCRTPSELQAAIISNQCVAVDIRSTADSESIRLVGEAIG